MSRENLRATSWWERYRTSVEAGETHRAEVLVRSVAPGPGGHARRDRVLDGLERATGARLLDGYLVTVTGEKLCLCESCLHTPPGARMLRKFALLRDWGGEAVRTLSFSEREVDSTITGERYRVLVPPELCLAVYVDDALEGVFPCSIHGSTFGATAFLDALEGTSVSPQVSAVDA